MWWILTGLTAALIVLTDFFLTFDLSSVSRVKSSTLYVLLCFTLLNMVFAIILHSQLFNHRDLSVFAPWVRAVLLGAGYAILVNMKLATLKFNNQEFPIGLELVYQNLKRICYTYINREVIRADYNDALRKAQKGNLKDLASEVFFFISANRILSEEKRKDYKDWLLEVITDPFSTDLQKKILLCHFLNCEERISSSDANFF